MNKLSVKERVNLYKQITDARKEFFKKLRQHDMGEVAIQDIQLKALEPVTGKLEEVKKQAQEIYVEIQEYFRLNRMDEEIAEMKKIYEEIKNVNEKLAFVKQVLEDIVNKQDLDFDEAKEEAKEDVIEMADLREGREMEKEDIASREERKRRKEGQEMIDLREKRRREMEKEDFDAGVLEQKEGDTGKSDAGESGVLEQKKSDAGESGLVTTKQQQRFEKIFIPYGQEGSIKLNKRDVENLNITRLKELFTKRYPSIKGKTKITQLTKQNINELRDLLVENLSYEAMAAYLGQLKSSPLKGKRVIDTGAAEVKGEGIMKKKRGRPRKKQQTGKGMKKRGRPKKEDKHLVNSLVLHTGSKAAGNDNLDNDIKQIINRMHKNKMITKLQKKELLEKYI